MKKQVFLALSMASALMLTACGTSSSNIEKADDTVESSVNESETINESTNADEAVAEETSDENAQLPAYEYPGPEYFYHSVYQYIVEEYASYYEVTDVSIPYVNEIEVDMTNRDDIIMYGDFWLYNYNLEGDTLVCVSGGAYPGVIHLNADFDVVSMDVVEDGSHFTDSAKKLFGKHYDKFMEIESDSEARNQIRAQIIANYVAANALPITKYQDEGWDPVILPEENIDSFYSDLN